MGELLADAVAAGIAERGGAKAGGGEELFTKRQVIMPLHGGQGAQREIS